jgi:hypothetical protein
VTPAPWIRRLLGHARSAYALDDPWGVAGCAIELEAAVAPGDWVANVHAGAARAQPIRAAGLEAMGQVERIAVGLVRWRGELRPGPRHEARHEIEASIAKLIAVDPVVDLARPRYRWRLPWTGAALAHVHELLAWLFGNVPEGSAEVPDAAAALARCEDLAAVALQTVRSSPPDDATLAACRAAVHAMCDDQLARERVWPEPLRVHHATWLRGAVDRAVTPTDVDIASHHGAACFAIEACWWHALVISAGWPLRAALLASYEDGVSVDIARSLSATLVGEPDPLRVPWLARLVADNLAPNAADEPIGAWAGEAGFELLGPYRTWRGLGGSDVCALTATADPASPASIRLWDREVALADADALRSAPSRPGIPGWPLT